MENEGPENVDGIREEHRTKVFDRYENQSKSFRKLFGGSVGFALIFFFLVLFPYVSIQMEKSQITGRLKTLPAQIVLKQKRLGKYQAPQQGIEKLRVLINKSPQALREFILCLNPAQRILKPNCVRPQLAISPRVPFTPGSPVQQMAPQSAQQGIRAPKEIMNLPSSLQGRPGSRGADPCGSLRGNKWVSCRVRHEVLGYLREYDRILGQDVVGPLQLLGGEIGHLIDPRELKTQLTLLKASFQKRLDENPRFWRTVRGKGAFFSVKLDSEVERFWRKFDTHIRGYNQRLKKELAHLRKEKKGLGDQQKKLGKMNEKLAARLSEIESPMGKLPIGLVESVLVFPVLLGILFLGCTSLLCDTMRLRRELQNLYQTSDQSGTGLTGQQVSLIAPLWIDPIHPWRIRFINCVIFFVPFAVFLVSVGLTLYSWSISETNVAASGLTQTMYAALYILGLVGFIYGTHQIINAWRSYLADRDDFG